jgi:hypothetical protein
MPVLAHSTKRLTRSSFYRLAVIVFLLSVVSPILPAQQQPDLDALASEMATAIFRSTEA